MGVRLARMVSAEARKIFSYLVEHKLVVEQLE